MRGKQQTKFDIIFIKDDDNDDDDDDDDDDGDGDDKEASQWYSEFNTIIII